MKKEDIIYYALVKGHELTDDIFKYWSSVSYNPERLLVGSKYPKASCINRMNKAEWNKIGITDLNADFVKVKEVE